MGRGLFMTYDYYTKKRNKRDNAFTYRSVVREKLARCHALYVQDPSSLFATGFIHAPMTRKLHYTTLHKSKASLPLGSECWSYEWESHCHQDISLHD